MTLLERIPTKKESSEVGKVFMKRRKTIVHVCRHIDRLRRSVPKSLSHALMAGFSFLSFFFFFNHYYGAFLLVFFWPVILICLVPNPYVVYLSIFSYVHMHLLDKMDSTKEASG